jgi:uncharacterized membrane protein YkvA (DUF1232 family)
MDFRVPVNITAAAGGSGPSKNKRRPTTLAWMFFFLALLYDVFPLDFIPDFIFPVGFLDDLAITAIASINLAEKIFEQNRWRLAGFARKVKWAIIGAAALAAGFFALLIAVMVKILLM